MTQFNRPLYVLNSVVVQILALMDAGARREHKWLLCSNFGKYYKLTLQRIENSDDIYTEEQDPS